MLTKAKKSVHPLETLPMWTECLVWSDFHNWLAFYVYLISEKSQRTKRFRLNVIVKVFVPFSLALSFTFSFFLPIRFKSKSQRPRSSACYSNILFRYSILFVNGSILFLRSGNITVERNVIRHTHIKLLSMNFRDSHIHTKKITWAVGGHS